MTPTERDQVQHLLAVCVIMGGHSAAQAWIRQAMAKDDLVTNFTQEKPEPDINKAVEWMRWYRDLNKCNLKEALEARKKKVKLINETKLKMEEARGEEITFQEAVKVVNLCNKGLRRGGEDES